MNDIVRALGRALSDLFQPKILWQVIWPLVLSVVVWIGIAIVFGDDAVAWLTAAVRESGVGKWLAQWLPVDSIAGGAGVLAIVVLLIPLTLVTASLIIGFFSMPAMVAFVAGRDYPRLERRRGGTLVGSVWNAVVAVVAFLAVGALTLPLWLIPVLWPVLGALLMGYLNQRLFRYDALSEHASAEEMQRLFRRDRGALFGLGVIVSLFSYVPLAGLLVPVASGLAFIHYGLARLAVDRGGGVAKG